VIHRPKHHLFLAVEACLVLALGTLSLVVRAHPGPLPGDVGLAQTVQRDLLHGGLLTQVIEAVSTLFWPVPTAITLGLIVVIFLALRRWLDAAVALIAALASSNQRLLLSKWVHRPRPYGHGIHLLQHITTSYSFPSGHVTYAVTVFGLFLFLSSQIRRPIHPLLIWAVRVVLVCVIVLMPVSRVLEGEHWPSDTLGGILDGLFWVVLVSHLYLCARSRWPALLAPDEHDPLPAKAWPKVGQ
jgi:membrane-associated phospholipid phosphatase